MAHIAENSHPLSVNQLPIQNRKDLDSESQNLTDVCIIRLPTCKTADEYDRPLDSVGKLVAQVANNLESSATLIVLGELVDLVDVQSQMPPSVRYQLWIAIKRTSVQINDNTHLPHQHFGALVLTRYKKSLQHTKTRLAYTYCPTCDKTTKDYGGKKHTYHEDGTLLSDVWRDISCDPSGDISPIVNRFTDLFGLEPYRTMTILDCRSMKLHRLPARLMHFEFEENILPPNFINRILHGDCLEKLRGLPSNSIDFAFADPPYNLGKNYTGYSDDREVQSYFTWCDEWIGEMARVLKPGRTLAILNIPLWAVRHFIYMQTILKFQNWIVWDALAFPVRFIMPAHYTILCFTKGESRPLPGLTGESTYDAVPSAPKWFQAFKPMSDGFCLRSNCVDIRLSKHIDDRMPLTDIWSDIHRLKHNSRRVDHPCQLPPHLMYRLISIFTKPQECVLDCFNGAGTSTLAAHQLGRKYVGIESSEKYCKLAEQRHLELLDGFDPFRKEERILTSKNSRVKRLPKQIYKVPKKTLQLEVKRVAQRLGHLPSRDEVIKFAKYPIDYYDKYFVSWGEVCAAARTTGMSEKRVNTLPTEPPAKQLQLLERKASLKSARR